MSKKHIKTPGVVMECNKDEAVRAKEIAERKITEKDYTGARKFTLKAQNLYPQLDGLSQMLTIIDVHISAEKKINGEADWYGVLGVNPLADEETVRRQYRKLALILHPDKNKSRGADGAFKLVSEAWSLLSDKTKRLNYNQKRGSGAVQQKFATQSGVSSQAPSANGFHNSTNTTTSKVRASNGNLQGDPASFSSPLHQKPSTFWTICNGCKTQYEYLRIYLNHTLLCPNCHEAFLALERAPPPNVLKASNWSSNQQHQNSGHHSAGRKTFNPRRDSAGPHSSNNMNFQWGSFSRSGGVNGTSASPSTAAQAASVVQQAHEKVKRELEEARATSEWDASKRAGSSALKANRAFKKRRGEDIRVNGYVGSMTNQMSMGTGTGPGSSYESGRGKFDAASNFGFSSFYNKPKIERDLSPLEIRDMLIKKARDAILKNLKGSSVTEVRATNKEKEKPRDREKRGHRSIYERGGSAVAGKEYQDKNSCPVSVADDSDEPLSINVPDPDFHNFDLDRAENSFADDQVWAAYDDDDGMPRYYARIHKVISLKPFKMKISWLNSRSNTELGPLDWVGSGFSKTCGDFRCGRHEITETLNSFSHKVQWMKGSRGVIRIYPRKGDVWALYRNWSSDWDEHTPDEVIHKYDMVEVLDDYNEEEGVTVSLLVKVAGLRTVFRKCIDSKEVRIIPKGEMFRFSHQVPNYVLTGKEAPNAPAGFRELDPAATPLELLQVVTEAKETLAGENRKAEEVTPVSKEDEKVANAPEAMKVERVEEDKKDKEASGDR